MPTAATWAILIFLPADLFRDHSIRIDFDLGLLCGRLAPLQIAGAAERGLPILLQLCGDETIVRIAGGIPALGQTRLVLRLPQFQIQDSLLFFLLL
jgi:hypothetical protein